MEWMNNIEEQVSAFYYKNDDSFVAGIMSGHK